MHRRTLRPWPSWLLVLLALAQTAVYGQQPSGESAQKSAQSSVVTKYINALQKRDFKTVIDLTASYQADIAQIKAQNPQVLWPRLLSEYYDKKISEFSKQADYWESYGEAMSAMLGDPAQALRATAVLLPIASKWTITESRDTVIRNPLTGTAAVRITYIQVAYAKPETSPIVEVPSAFQVNKRLKKCIVQFETDPKTQLVRSVGRLAAGDEYWPIPPLTRETATNLVPNFHMAGYKYGGWQGFTDEIIPHVAATKCADAEDNRTVNSGRLCSEPLLLKDFEPKVVELLQANGF